MCGPCLLPPPALCRRCRGCSSRALSRASALLFGASRDFLRSHMAMGGAAVSRGRLWHRTDRRMQLPPPAVPLPLTRALYSDGLLVDVRAEAAERCSASWVSP